MSSFLRGRIRRLEQAAKPSTVMIAIIPDGASDAEAEAILAGAHEAVGEDGTVIWFDHRDGVYQRPGPPTRRKARPGDTPPLPPDLSRIH